MMDINNARYEFSAQMSFGSDNVNIFYLFFLIKLDGTNETKGT